MKRDLLQRVERLEFQAKSSRRVIYCWVDPGDEHPRRALTDNERIVRDLYRVDGNCGWARERITNDPADQGRTCLPGTYLEDILRDLHQVCDMRDYGCNICSGLEHLFSPPNPEPPLTLADNTDPPP
jgi:hypothetical protein